MSSPEALNDTWASLLAQLTQLQDGKPDYAAANYLHERQWTGDTVLNEFARLQSGDALLQRLLALSSIERSKVQVAEARVDNANNRASSLAPDVLLVIFEYYMLSVGADPMTLAAVCSSWLNLVLGDAGTVVWSHLVVENHFPHPFSESIDITERRISHFLLRSQSHPLHLRLIGEAPPPAVVSLIHQGARRIQTIDSPDEALTPFLPFSPKFANLRRISIDKNVSPGRWGSGPSLPPPPNAWPGGIFGLQAPPVEPAAFEDDLEAEPPILEESGASLVSSPCPSLNTAFLSMHATPLASALRELSAWASLTHLTVDVLVSSGEGMSVYDALAGLIGLEELSWTDDDDPHPPNPHRSISLLHLHTLSLFGEDAIHAFSAGIRTPSLRYLHLQRHSLWSAANSSFATCELLQASAYATRLPLLEIVKYVHVNINIAHLFSLLATHPTLREVQWEGERSTLKDLMASMTVVMGISARVNVRDGRDVPFLTIGYLHPPPPAPKAPHPSVALPLPAEERDDLVPPVLPVKGKKGVKGRRTVTPISPEEHFSKTLVAELLKFQITSLLTAGGTLHSPIFRIGVAADFAARWPAISNFARQSPETLSISPRWFD